MIATLISRSTLVPSPSPGVGVMGGTYYTRRDGRDVLSLYNYLMMGDRGQLPNEDGNKSGVSQG